MALFSTQGAKAVGKGLHSPPGSLLSDDLAKSVAGYKRSVASRYQALIPDEIVSALSSGKFWVSPKVDGEQWCLVLDQEDGCFLANPRGRVLSGDLPLLNEAEKILSKLKGTTVVAGELFAAKKRGRPRHGDLATALAGGDKAEVERLAFMGFDLVWGGDETEQMPLEDYPKRLAVIERLFESLKRIRTAKTEVVSGADAVSKLFDTWVTEGKAEGLVVRTDANRILKVKPAITIDAAVIAYTERSEDSTQASSFLLALMREDGLFQLVGHCGNLGSEDQRRDLLKEVKALSCPSNYREANSRGALYQFIRPKLVAEILISDVQAERSDGNVMPRMVLSFENESFQARRFMPGVSLISPRLVRMRDDKEAHVGDVPVKQVFDRVFLPEATSTVDSAPLPSSTLMRRAVYTKTTKGLTAVRKLLVWKTNKESEDSSFPAFVVHWTDYSPVRKEPLKRTVRLAPSETVANDIAEGMLAKEIKKGWALSAEM